MENKNQLNTHLLASKSFVGSIVEISKDSATAVLDITKDMVVDGFGLAHGSFVFGLADFAAMAAINEPTVVLGKAEVKFTKPVVLNDKVTALATITENNGKKISVTVAVTNAAQELVFEGVFTCFVLEKHILDS